MKVLLVEDHQDSADVTAQLMRKCGYSVTVAVTLAEAKALCQRERFDVFLCDIGLPDGSGEELVITARECNSKIIAFTGYGTASSIANFEKAGFDAIIIKPASLVEIICVIQKVCQPPPPAAGDMPHFTATP